MKYKNSTPAFATSTTIATERNGRTVLWRTGSVLSPGPGSGNPYQGRAELAAFISAPERTPLQHRNWNTALTLERNGEDINAVCYAFLLQVANVESPKIVGSVTYRDILARENGA